MQSLLLFPYPIYLASLSLCKSLVCFSKRHIKSTLFNWWPVIDLVTWEIQQSLPLSIPSYIAFEWMNIITGLGNYKLFAFLRAKSYWSKIPLIPLFKIRIYFSMICFIAYRSYFSKKIYFMYIDLLVMN